jgi:uncharacterized protein YcfJ
LASALLLVHKSFAVVPSRSSVTSVSSFTQCRVIPDADKDKDKAPAQETPELSGFRIGATLGGVVGGGIGLLAGKSPMWVLGGIGAGAAVGVGLDTVLVGLTTTFTADFRRRTGAAAAAGPEGLGIARR